VSRLPVRRLATLQASGSEHIEHLVECPAIRRSLPVEACAHCGHGTVIGADEALDAEAVECDRAEEAGAHGEFEARINVVPVMAVASRDVIAVSADATVEHARAMMVDAVVGCLPVIDAMRRPIGIITPLDLVTRPDARIASEAMTAPVATVMEMTSTTRAAALMAFEGIHHLPVVNQNGSIVALLSSLDLLRHLGRQQGFLVPDEGQRRRSGTE